MPRCALEVDDAGQFRIDKILAMVRGCRLGVQDISRTELDTVYQLPRFNMPFELGVLLLSPILDVASSSTCPVFVARDLSASFSLCAGACPGTERPRWKRVMRPIAPVE